VSELFPDFRDLLVELADAGAELVVVGAGRDQDLADVRALEAGAGNR
jgi:hypothetical protein